MHQMMLFLILSFEKNPGTQWPGFSDCQSGQPYFNAL